MNFTYGPRKFLKLFTILSFLIASSVPAFSKVTSRIGSDVKLTEAETKNLIREVFVSVIPSDLYSPGSSTGAASLDDKNIIIEIYIYYRKDQLSFLYIENGVNQYNFCVISGTCTLTNREYPPELHKHENRMKWTGLINLYTALYNESPNRYTSEWALW